MTWSGETNNSASGGWEGQKSLGALFYYILKLLKKLFNFNPFAVHVWIVISSQPHPVHWNILVAFSLNKALLNYAIFFFPFALEGYSELSLLSSLVLLPSRFLKFSGYIPLWSGFHNKIFVFALYKENLPFPFFSLHGVHQQAHTWISVFHS